MPAPVEAMGRHYLKIGNIVVARPKTGKPVDPDLKHRVQEMTGQVVDWDNLPPRPPGFWGKLKIWWQNRKKAN